MDPLHLTEFASERYFSKLRQLNENPDHASSSSANSTVTTTATVSPLPPIHSNTFTLPLGRQRSLDNEAPPLVLRPSDQKKRSLGHDLSTLRTQRRPSFSGSFGSLRSKVTIIHKSPSIVEHHEEILAANPTAAPTYVFHHLCPQIVLTLSLQLHTERSLPHTTQRASSSNHCAIANTLDTHITASIEVVSYIGYHERGTYCTISHYT